MTNNTEPKSGVRDASDASGAPVEPHAWLASLLEARRITNAGLARRLGVSAVLVSAWKNGTQKIPLARAEPLAHIIGVDPHLMRNILFASACPGTWAADERIRRLGRLTQGERRLLEILRHNAVANVRMNEAQKEAFRRFAATLSRGPR